jgi:hypothetical protein
MGLTYKQKFNLKFGFEKDKAHSVAEISKLTGFNKNNLQKIIEKGEGAFFSNPSSVRKSVSSPKQWGVGRLYSAVMKGKASVIDKDLLK